MQYRVNQPFNFNGMNLRAGQIVELDIIKAGQLQCMRLISKIQPERAVNPPEERPQREEPERAVKKPGEKRGRKPKVKDEPDTDSTTGN